MDWDWEDAPRRDAPQPRPEEPSQAPSSETTFSGAVEHFERPLPPPPREDVLPPEFDDERTQIIRRPEEPPVTAPDATSFAEAIERFESPAPEPRAARPDPGGPRRGAEAGQRDERSGAAGERFDGRRARTPESRAAARARRRRQIRRRRLTALAVLIVIVALIVVLVVRGCGGPAEGQAATLGAAPLVVLGAPALAPLRAPALAEAAHFAARAGRMAACDVGGAAPDTVADGRALTSAGDREGRRTQDMPSRACS